MIKLRSKIKASYFLFFSLFISDSRCSEFGGAQNSAVCVCECSEREEDLEWGGGGGGLESQVSIVRGPKPFLLH